MMEGRVIIIGAGPAGLGAGYRLGQLGYERFHLYERNAYIGGLCGSFTDSAGFTWDVGGHVMFSHYEYYDRLFEELMGGEFQLNNRECWIRILGTWVPYPFQNNIRHLPPGACYECLLGLLKAQADYQCDSAANCAQFMRSAFGEGIWKHFMQPYNFKVWAHPTERLSTRWLGQRVAVVDAERALRNVVFQRDDVGWGPNNLFKYPLRGGTGEFFRRFAGLLGTRITLGRSATEIDTEAKRVRFADGGCEDYDCLISTMPLDLLIGMLRPQPPWMVRGAAANLSHSGGHMVGIGIRQKCPSARSWMYFPEDNCPFYRVTYLSNYSPFMTPDGERHYSLLCETSYSPYKPVAADTIVPDTIRGLMNCGLLKESDQEDIVSTWHYDAAYSYPVPIVERDGALAELVPYLEGKRIFSRGRFGMWKYEVGNTDHSLMQGVELVNRLLLGEAETTIGIVYPTAGEGQESITHVRAGAAELGGRSAA